MGWNWFEQVRTGLRTLWYHLFVVTVRYLCQAVRLCVYFFIIGNWLWNRVPPFNKTLGKLFLLNRIGSLLVVPTFYLKLLHWWILLSFCWKSVAAVLGTKFLAAAVAGSAIINICFYGFFRIREMWHTRNATRPVAKLVFSLHSKSVHQFPTPTAGINFSTAFTMARIWTHVRRVAPTRDLLKDALPADFSGWSAPLCLKENVGSIWWNLLFSL